MAGDGSATPSVYPQVRRMRPILSEILRARLPLRPDVLQRWQRELRDVIGPDLDAYDALKAAKPEKRQKADTDTVTA